MSYENGNGSKAHKWVMVGFWHLTDEQIQESFIEGEPMQLGKPDEVDGPGCFNCEVHWLQGRDKPCPGAMGS